MTAADGGRPPRRADTATTRARRSPSATPDGTPLRRALVGRRATATGRTLLAGSRALLARRAGRARRRSAGSSSGPAPGRSPGCGSASRRPRRSRTRCGIPIVGVSTGEALLAARRRRPRSCSSPPGRHDRVLTPAGRAPRDPARRRRSPTSSRRDGSSRSTSTDRAPADAVAAGEAARRARGARSCGPAPRGSRRATSTTSRCSSPSTSTLPRGVRDATATAASSVSRGDATTRDDPVL